MFLSALVSHYQPDGTLSVDLREQGGPIVGYGPFAAGMPWFRRRGGGWVETAYDWGARLVNPAHESRQDLPVLRYLEPWPRDFIRALHPVWYKNLCLAYLAAAGDAEALGLCRAQFDARHNMTDQIAALRLLMDAGGAAGEEALAVFYDTWAGDPLVLDKWFAIQASAKGPETLARVRHLLGHPAYSPANPNRVRSLVASFCANQVRFHAADGAGYAFLGERVLELDPLNPQIAARLLQSLVRWRRFDPARRTLMRAELERVLAVDGLSKDAYEVASKGLA